MIFLTILIIFLIHDVFAENLKIICNGPAESKLGIIYLHGLDTINPSSQELNNRKIIENLATTFNARFAILRSDTSHKNVLQWDQHNKKTVQKTYNKINQSTTDCFKNQKKIIAIGFSNGGYFLNKVVQYCLNHKFLSIISIGSAGSFKYEQKTDLTECGELILLIGKNDKTLIHTKKYKESLKKLKSQVKLIIFDGGHEISLKSLKKILRQVLKNSRAA